MKSIGLVATPRGVVTRTLPDAVASGTNATTALGVDESTLARVPVNRTRLFVGTGSKFAPTMVMGVPAAPICGTRLVITGTPFDAVTVNGVALLAVFAPT